MLDNIVNFAVAIGALGTASFGIVDSSKFFRGGISNAGFGHVLRKVKPFKAALLPANPEKPFETLRANWINGVDKATQKATTKSLIRLGLTPETVEALAAATPGIDKGCCGPPARLTSRASRRYQSAWV